MDHQVATVVLLASDDRILKIRKAPPARTMSTRRSIASCRSPHEVMNPVETWTPSR